MNSRHFKHEDAPCLTQKEKEVESSPNAYRYKKEGKLTVLEKVLGFFLVVAVIALIALIVVVVRQNDHDDDDDNGEVVNKNTACVSPECVVAAARIHDSVDRSVDPCEDFYTYSCGKWMSSRVIPEDRSSLGTFTVLRNQVIIVLKKLLESERKDDDLGFINKAKDLYASCMDVERLEDKDGQPLKGLLESQFGGWPLTNTSWTEDNFDIVEVATTLFQLHNSALFRFYVYTDSKNSSMRTLKLDQASFGMPGQKYYLVKRNDTMLNAYQNLIYSTANLMVDRNKTKLLEDDVKDIVDFEIELARIAVPDEERRDNNALYNNMTLGYINSTYGEEFDWSRFVKTLTGLKGVEVPNVTDEEIIINRSPAFFHSLTGLLKKTPNKVKANYMIWRVVFSYLSKQSEKYRELLKVYRKALYGQASDVPRYETCVSHTTSHLGLAVGHLFIKDNFDADAKSQASEMIDNLQKSFDELLDHLDWMDEETKKVAKDKNKHINAKIGYPEEITNTTYMEILYENYTYTDDDYFNNTLGARRENFKNNFRRLREPVDKTTWSAAPSTVNAYYSASKNQIMFPAGIFQPPFFSSSYPKSLNYGGIGMVIGHEITHGFDDQGRQYDKDGNLKQWWSESAIDKFKGKAQCVIDQYGNFTVEEVDMNLNGINTQGENIADNGGLKQSFRAYRNWVASQGKEEMPLPGLDFTHNQLFFINFAQLWCNLMRKGDAISRIRSGVHSPGQFRVIGSVQNSPDFNEAFKCKPESAMNKKNKCNVW